MIRTILAASLCFCAVALTGCASQKTQTPQPGRAVVEAYVSAWNRHDYVALDKLLAPDAVHEDIAWRFVARGPAQINDALRMMIATEPDMNWRLTTVVDDGDLVAVEWTWTATFSGDTPLGHFAHRHISGRGASVVAIENGRIKRFTDYYDMASFFPRSDTQSGKN